MVKNYLLKGLFCLMSPSRGPNKGFGFLVQKPRQWGIYLLVQDLECISLSSYFFLLVFQKILLLFASARMGSEHSDVNLKPVWF